jgi:glycosyltransferase involved in cell wall biosynthesis
LSLRIGIDASNLRAGGGLTHLQEFLEAVDPNSDDFSLISVWAPTRTLDRLPKRAWLIPNRHPLLDGNSVSRQLWRNFKLDKAVARAKCDILFVPGGSYAGTFRPIVTMSRNLLPFDRRARALYGYSRMRAKLTLLRWIQSRTFKKADGIIFLTKTARDLVLQAIGTPQGDTRIVPHGVSPKFFLRPRRQRAIHEYSSSQPFRLLYVSPIAPYKHQPSVVTAIAQLAARGAPVCMDLVGAADRRSKASLEAVLRAEDPSGKLFRYLGAVSYDELQHHYRRADAFVFASSCENLPNILLEAMAAGLPIACSDRSVMPEVLGDGGVYFDPESPDSIAATVSRLLNDSKLRESCADVAWERARAFTWQQCARKTVAFLHDVASASHVAPTQTPKR